MSREWGLVNRKGTHTHCIHKHIDEANLITGPWETRKLKSKGRVQSFHGKAEQLWLLTQSLFRISCFADQQSYHESHSWTHNKCALSAAIIWSILHGPFHSSTLMYTTMHNSLINWHPSRDMHYSPTIQPGRRSLHWIRVWKHPLSKQSQIFGFSSHLILERPVYKIQSPSVLKSLF